MQQRFPLLAAIWEWNRAKVTIMLVLVITIGALLGWKQLWLEPQLQKLRDRQLVLQQQVLQHQLDYTSSGVSVSVVERLEQQMVEFNDRIPPRQDLSIFLGELYDWAEQTGLEIERISFSPDIDKENGLLRYGLSFNVVGDYSRVRYFIHLLEQAPRILIIDKIALAGHQSSRKNAAGVALKIELTTYFREERG